MKTYRLLFFGPEQKVITDFLEEQSDYIEIFDDTKVDFLFINGDVFKEHSFTLLPPFKNKILVTGEVCNIVGDFNLVCCPNYSNNPKIIYFNQFLLNSLPYLKSHNIITKPLEESRTLFLYSNGFPYFRRYLCKSLQKYIPIDCLGKVLNNIARTPQRSSDFVHPNWENDKKDILLSYEYCLACENSFVSGYISEKMWHCLEVGIIPIYMGAPDVSLFVPKECFINVRDYINRKYFFILTLVMRFSPLVISKTYWYIRHLEWLLQALLGIFIPWDRISKDILVKKNKRGLNSEELLVLQSHKTKFLKILHSSLESL